VGIAGSFAAKDSLANLFGGIFIIRDAPYKIGDFIILDSGERGRVVKIGLRSTRLLTRDDVEVTLPNLYIANSKVVNESGARTKRLAWPSWWVWRTAPTSTMYANCCATLQHRSSSW